MISVPKSRADWKAIFDEVGWSAKLENALRDVAGARDADPPDRQRAVKIWKDLTDLGVLSGPTLGTANLLREIAMDLLIARYRDEGVARRMHDVMLGVDKMLGLAAQFVELPGLQEETKPSTSLGAN